MAVTVNIPSEVSQSITNGVTDKAPSENVVFDALATKEDVLGFTPENTANKQNSLTVDGTGVKFVTVDAVNSGLSGKQDTLVSGANIKTINGSSVLGSGDIVLSSGITVGTTAIDSGVDTRVLFQQGGVVQQDANFTFNNTQKRLTLKAVGTAATDIPFAVQNSAGTSNLAAISGNGLAIIGINASSSPTLIIDPSGSARATLRGGTNQSISLNNSGWNNLNGGSGGWDIEATGGEIRQRNGSNYTLLSGNFFGIGRTPSARLDVQAQGALSTDIAFRVRNSANTLDIMNVAGNGDFYFNSMSTTTPIFDFSVINGGSRQSILRIVSGGFNSVPSRVDFQVPFSAGGDGLNIFNQKTGVDQLYLQMNRNNFCLGSNTIATSTTERRVIYINNGVAPSSSVTDGFKLYSADIVAGNAAPHFRTENGDVQKIYSIGGWGTPTGTLTRTTFDTTTVTLGQLAERVAALISDLKTGHGLLKA